MQTKLQKTRVIDRAGMRFPSLPELVRGEVAGVARPVAGVADGGEPDLAAPARIDTAAASRVKCRRMHSGQSFPTQHARVLSKGEMDAAGRGGYSAFAVNPLLDPLS